MWKVAIKVLGCYVHSPFEKFLKHLFSSGFLILSSDVHEYDSRFWRFSLVSWIRKMSFAGCCQNLQGEARKHVSYGWFLEYSVRNGWNRPVLDGLQQPEVSPQTWVEVPPVQVIGGQCCGVRKDWQSSRQMPSQGSVACQQAGVACLANSLPLPS